MHTKTWQQLLALETRDAVGAWHQKLCGRELNARRAREITAAARQAREYFRNAEHADTSVKPLLTFYGVASLSRAVLLLFKRDVGEAALAQGHGLQAVGWANTLSADIPAGLLALDGLRIKTSNGLFTQFLIEVNNRMCMHVHSSNVDWSIDYALPPLETELTFGDLLSRTPDLMSEHQRALRPINYAWVNEMTYTVQEGFRAKARSEQLRGFGGAYEALGYVIKDEAGWSDLSAGEDVFNAHVPQFMHTYVNKTFGSIPSLHLAKPFENGARYSQPAITYMLAYCLGMLARYFPTHWVSLFSADKGDALWPEVNAAQRYVEIGYPQMILELIQRGLDLSAQEQ